MNMFCSSDECFSTEDECIENVHLNFSPTQIHITSNFQTELSRMLLTGTCLQKQAVAITLSCSPSFMLHPQVIFAIVLSAGLNGLQVDQVDRENDK